jgi:hypothetical protein
MNTVLDLPQSRIDREKNDDREREDSLIGEQRRQAAEEKARRAREQMELLRQLEIQNSRRAAGLCIWCGHPLASIARLFRSVKHPNCKTFAE